MGVLHGGLVEYKKEKKFFVVYLFGYCEVDLPIVTL